MGRGKVQMKRIENANARHVTFSKRKLGLMRKAGQLSLLCDAEVALIISSPAGRLYHYGSHSMNNTIRRYQNAYLPDDDVTEDYQNLKVLQSHYEYLNRKLETLEQTQRNINGEALSALSLTKLDRLERKLQGGVSKIRNQRKRCFSHYIKSLTFKRNLKAENSVLRKEYACKYISPVESLQLLENKRSEEPTITEEPLQLMETPFLTSLDLRLS